MVESLHKTLHFPTKLEDQNNLKEDNYYWDFVILGLIRTHIAVSQGRKLCKRRLGPFPEYGSCSMLPLSKTPVGIKSWELKGTYIIKKSGCLEPNINTKYNETPNWDFNLFSKSIEVFCKDEQSWGNLAKIKWPQNNCIWSRILLDVQSIKVIFKV